MRKPILVYLLGSILFALACLPTSTAQVPLERVASVTAAKGVTSYQYVFENERFTTPLIEVTVDGKGHGRFRFRKKDADEIINDLKISTTLVNQIQALFDEARFLETDENYQYKKDFSHLGKVTLKVSRDGRQRTASFNYTDNNAISRITEIFRNIATQETRVFEIETIRESDPISTPAQLRMLEGELRSKLIAEPDRFSPLLHELKTDESVPLIARNHADRLLKMIEKGKK